MELAERVSYGALPFRSRGVVETMAQLRNGRRRVAVDIPQWVSSAVPHSKV